MPSLLWSAVADALKRWYHNKTKPTRRTPWHRLRVELLEDRLAPAVTLISPTDLAYVRQSISLQATADDANLDHVEFFVDSVDKGAGTLNAGVWSFSIDTTTLTDAAHTWSASAFDTSSELSTSVTRSFTVDNTAPTAGTVNDGTSADIDFQTSTNTISANWSGFTDAGSGIASYQWAIGTTIGGSDTMAFTDVGLTTSATATGLTLPNGTRYFVTHIATDAAGNTRTVSSDGVRVDTNSPDILNFAGLTSSPSPPDTNMDVGPRHVIQMVNATRYQVFDKAGNALTGALLLGNLWPVGDPGRGNAGDPIVVYDHLADRWVLTQFNNPTSMCFAISRTPDPVGGVDGVANNGDEFYTYTFNVGVFPDYPKIGVWPDGYYMTSYEGANLGIFAFDRAKMLLGQPATFVKTTISSLTGNPGIRDTRILPSDLDGPAPPPGTPNYFVRTVDGQQDTSNPTDRIEIYTAVPNFTTSTLTFTLSQTLSPSAFNIMPGDRNGGGVRDCIPQPNTTQTLDSLSNRPMMQLKYRNFGTYQAMVFNQTIDVQAMFPGVATEQTAGIRFYELRKPSTSWSIYQEGTYAPQISGLSAEAQLLHRWMGSAAMDSSGNIAIGYSIVNSDSAAPIFPSMAFSSRLAGDALGAMGNEHFFFNGTVSQTSTMRWGDYSAMSVDPVDDSTFWYTTHAAGSPKPTRLVSFLLNPNPVLTATALDNNIVIRRSASDNSLIEVLIDGAVTNVYVYAEINSITIRGLDGSDTLTIDHTNGNPLPANGVNFDGGTGTDRAVAGNSAPATTWIVNALNAGSAFGGAFTFTNVERLTGSAAADTFRFTGSGQVAGVVTGSGGGDALDYSGFTGGAAIVNLNTSTATLTGGFATINRAIGNNNTGSTIIGPNAASTWTFTAQNAGAVGTFSFASFPNLTGGTGTDTFDFSSGFSLTGTLKGGTTAANTLIGPNLEKTWTINANNAGFVPGVVGAFSNIQNLTGGSARDIFVFANNSALVAGRIRGGDGSNWLDFSPLTVAVTVNLASGVCSRAAGGVQQISNVSGSASGGSSLTGSASGGILVGRGAGNILAGGAGRSLLIGGFGANTLTGGAADDILINGRTIYDADFNALESILATWKSTSSYTARIAALTQLKIGVTVFISNGSPGPRLGRLGGISILRGNGGADWFITNILQSVVDRQPGEVVTT